MYKVVWFARFPPHMSNAEARRYWSEHHGPSCAATTDRAATCRTTSRGPVPAVSGVPEEKTHFDGYSCGWWSDRAAFDATMATPEWQALEADGDNVFDMTWLHGMSAALQEYTVIDGPSSPFKVLWMVRFKEGIENAEAHRYWEQVHGSIFKQLDIDRYVQNHVVGEVYAGNPAGFDGFSECWFQDEAQFLAAIQSDAWAEAVADGRTSSTCRSCGARSSRSGSRATASSSGLTCPRRSPGSLPRDDGRHAGHGSQPMILVTGGTGFIGVNVARALLDAGERVVLTTFDARSFAPSFLAHMEDRVFVEDLDVADAAAVLDVARAHRVDGIVHLVQSSGETTLAQEFHANALGLFNVLEAGRELGVRRACFASSVNVYSGLRGSGFSEDATVPLGLPDGDFPATITAFKKLEEVLAGYYEARSGMEVVALRIGFVWGPLCNWPNMPTRCVRAAVAGEAGPHPSPTGDADHADDGRDFVYVRDVARAIALVTGAPSLRHRVYNVGGGGVTTARMVADAIGAQIPTAELSLEDAGQPPPSRLRYAMDIARIDEELGFRPRPLEAAIADYIAWLGEGNSW